MHLEPKEAIAALSAGLADLILLIYKLIIPTLTQNLLLPDVHINFTDFDEYRQHVGGCST